MRGHYDIIGDCVMKILFIYPDIGKGLHWRALPFGIAYLSSFVKSQGHQASVIWMMERPARESFIGRVKIEKPDLVAFSTTTNQFPYVILCAKWIKECLGTPTVCGGVHATLCPSEVLSCKDIDIVCVGEGEYPLLELMDAMEDRKELLNIKNLWFKNDGKWIVNEVRPLITELDELPFPDREVFNHTELLRLRNYEADMLASRGCPYECTYCCNHTIREVYKTRYKYHRLRNVQNVLDEIKTITSKYNIKSLFFQDDVFTYDLKWLTEFCRAYPREFELPFQCNARAQDLNRDILLMLKRAGCHQISIGIECGNEWLRKRILLRSETNAEIVEIFRTAKELGLKTLSFNMIGLPFETANMFEETINLNALAQPTIMNLSIFYPYPKTTLHKICQEKGLINNVNEILDSYFERSILKMGTLTAREISRYRKGFKESVFFERILRDHARPHQQPFLRLLKHIFGRKWTFNLLKVLIPSLRSW